jgi:hypothetical protein
MTSATGDMFFWLIARASTAFTGHLCGGWALHSQCRFIYKLSMWARHSHVRGECYPAWLWFTCQVWHSVANIGCPSWLRAWKMTSDSLNTRRG